jgi:hypothetical protein
MQKSKFSGIAAILPAQKRGSARAPDEAAITQFKYLCDTHQLAYRYMELKTALSS